MGAVSGKLKRYRRVLAVIVILMVTAAVELAANIHALRGGYDDLDISENIEVIEDEGTEKYQVQFRSKDGIYVRQITLTGNFTQRASYRVRIKKLTGFGAKETEVYTDYVDSYFAEYSTDIGEKVTSVKITMTKEEGAELTGVSFSNRFELNIYRILFVLIALSLLYMAIFERDFIERIEWYFAAYALAFGLLLIAMAQPMCNSWDEQIHFKNVYTIASGTTVKWTQSAQDIAGRTNFRCNTKSEFAQLRAYMNENNHEIVEEEAKDSLLISYNALAYVPMALFYAVGKLIRLPFSALFAFGKLGNLLLYIFVMFQAIRLAPNKKLLLAFIAMMPTALFQACSYTYDAVVFSFLTLGCVLWCREAFFGKERMDRRAVAAACIFFVLGSLSKAVYIPLVLLLLVLPQIRKLPKKTKLRLGVGILLVFAIGMLTFMLPMVINVLQGNLAYGGDSRGGDTSAVRQLISMIKHPLESVKLFISSICRLDNFRNLGDAETDNYFFGNLMFLNYSSMGTLADKWCVLLLPVFTVLLFREESGNDRIARCGAAKKAVMWGVFAVIVLLIWCAMYLAFTPVGASEIDGVQARYYLPILYLGAVLVTSTRLKVQISYQAAAKLTCLGAWALQAAALWGLAFAGRLG